MEIKLKNGVLNINHKLKRSETYRLNKTKKYASLVIFKKPKLVSGMSSYCDDGKHTLFIDYDNVAKRIVIGDFNRIQQEFNLPPAYLFTTKEENEVGNYHIICLAKFLPRQIHQILSKTHSDLNYVSMPLRQDFRSWILRISNKGKRDKPKFLDVIGKINNLNKEISTPHYRFLYRIYKLPKINYKKFDKYKKIRLEKYETLN